MLQSRPIVVVLATIAALVGVFAATTTNAAAEYSYDGPTIAHVDVQAFASADAGKTQVSSAQEKSASPSRSALGASTTPSSRSVATNTVDDALAYATRAEKLDHVFVARHNLDPLVHQLGSREAVVQQMLNSVKGLTPASGTFEIPVTIGGQTVVVRGAVVDGVTKIGTAFTP